MSLRSLDRIDTLIIHHSGSPRTTTTGDMRLWHMGKGWRDIGYHIVVEGDGEIEYGRPLREIGAHCRGHNASSVGVCVVGDNTRSEHAWTDTQIVSLMQVVASFALIWPEIIVVGHKDLAATACPGVDVAVLLATG